MTVEGLTVRLQRTSPTEYAMPGRMFINLLRKELRESVGVVIAGLAIYWIMPAVIEFAYIAIDPRNEWVSGFALLLIMFTGWVYAIVIGAQTVCRDWGKAEERFLLAQPISPRAVVAAKLVAGLVVLLAVLGAGFLWDVLMDRFTPGTAGGSGFLNAEHLQFAVTIACIILAAFFVAFGVAFVSRQSLPSALVAGLILLIWAVAPLISGRLAVFHPSQARVGFNTLFTGVHNLHEAVPPNTVFVLTTGLCIVVSIVAALLTCTRDCVIRLGHKPLAWTTAIVVLLLFATGLSEVGNALPIRDQRPFYPEGWKADAQHGTRVVAQAAFGDRVVLVENAWQSWSEPIAQGEVEIYGTDYQDIVEFRVDEQGRICDTRQATLSRVEYGAAAPADPPELLPSIVCSGHSLPLLFVDGSPDEMILGGVAKGAAHRLRLKWSEGGEARIVAQSSVTLPHDERQCWGEQHLMTPRYSYVVYTETSQERKEGTVLSPAAASGHMLVIDWADDSHPRLAYSFPVPVETVVELREGNLIFKCPFFLNDGMVGIRDWMQTWIAADSTDAFDVIQADPGILFAFGHKEHWRIVPPFSLFGLTRAEGCCGPPDCDVGNDGFLFAGDELGLRVFDIGKFGPERLIGESWRSPLSRLVNNYWGSSWRSPFGSWWGWMTMQRVGDSLLVEAGLTTYDVSDPASPRRSGFFSADYTAKLLATSRHFVIAEGALVTVVDRPDQ